MFFAVAILCIIAVTREKVDGAPPAEGYVEPALERIRKADTDWNYVFTHSKKKGTVTLTFPFPRTGCIFSASMTKTKNYGDHKRPIIYDFVHTNIGNCYSAKDGKFRVKVAGLYQLTTTVAVHGSKAVHVLMVVNGKRILAATAVNWNTGSNMIYKHLKEGDVVWVHNGYGNMIRGELLSTFSARLLKYP